ncbi:MAG: uridine kinase [Spirochaetes bacterium]|uniref:Uridine kinase n=1 Tax=Candidatus Ornithospirochaeta stercoripullorum TaxID=2840899 RepID=A0A9D9H5D8_9SPIO|nr:uridine kinase [Candidatus Ornithospirochaeta stercoripullorum]
MTAVQSLLQHIAESTRIVAIDGRSASGKTTIASEMADVLGATIIHMDDFFLPLPLRTEARYREAGGNVHYERFIEEVLPGLENHEVFYYHRFDCSKMAYADELVRVDASRLVVVEGAYSLSPCFGHYYDFSVFMDIEAEEQMRRIVKRNGEERAEAFKTRWIPLEEAYFTATETAKRADLILDGAML